MKTKIVLFIAVFITGSHVFSQKATDTLPKNYMCADCIYIDRLPKASEVKSLELSKHQLDSKWELTNSKFLIALQNALALQPNDSMISGWHYSPWYTIGFSTNVGTYRVELYLGGLGFITLPNGKRGAALFKL